MRSSTKSYHMTYDVTPKETKQKNLFTNLSAVLFTPAPEWKQPRCPSTDDRPRKCGPGNSLAVQWLELRALTAKSLGSIPGHVTKIPQAVHAVWPKKKKKKTAIHMVEYYSAV